MGSDAVGWFFDWIMARSCFSCGLPAGFGGKQTLNMSVESLDLLLQDAVIGLLAD